MYNKDTTQRLIQNIVQEEAGQHAFIILDIDYFKSVNDNFGHIVGDKVLQTFGRFLQSQFREYDVVGRIGGEKTNELLNITGRPSDKFDIQLKGSGRTPYSRGGDGRAEDDNQCGDCFCTPAWKFFYGSLSKGGSCIVSDETCG